MITEPFFETKEELEEAVEAGLEITVSNPGPYGGDIPGGTINIDGFYVVIKDFIIVEVL